MSYTYNGKVCRHSSHYKMCEKLGRWVPFQVFRKKRAISKTLNLPHWSASYLLSYSRIHDHNLIYILNSELLPQDVLKYILSFYRRLVLTSHIQPLIESTNKNYTIGELPCFISAIPHYNFAEIETRLTWLFTNKHVDLFLDANRFYANLLTEEFADYILNKYKIDDLDNSNNLQLTNPQFAILVLLPHVRNKNCISASFPTEPKWMLKLGETFDEWFEVNVNVC